MSNAQQPADPFTALLTAAVQLHEMFVELGKAGFTAEQALYLVGQMVRPQANPA